MELEAWILAAMTSLVPAREHEHPALGGAIARAVVAEEPLFAADDDKRKTAAEMVAVAYRESSLRSNAVGDHGRAFCAFQIHSSSGGTAALLNDVDACARMGLAMLRTSLRVCPAFPIAWYAEGPRGCSSPRAQRISRDRMAIAQRLVRDIELPESTP